MIANLLRTELVRFGIVAILGLGLDFSLSLGLAYLGVPLTIAAACGFIVAAVVNYVIHENWTFATGQSASAARGARYLLVLACTFGVRIGAVAALEHMIAPASWRPAMCLFLATAISFCVNFLLSKFLVFTSPNKRKGSVE